jgi:hypothetical protein
MRHVSAAVSGQLRWLGMDVLSQAGSGSLRTIEDVQRQVVLQSQDNCGWSGMYVWQSQDN